MKVLLATDAKAAGQGAIRMAAILAREAAAEVEVVHVLEPLPVQGPGAVGSLEFAGDEQAESRSRAARERVGGALAEVAPAAADWPVHVEIGPAPLRIARRAESTGASLILLGSGRHRRVDRWFGTETALRVMQLAHVPVLAVPEEGGQARPRTIVAAVDFSEFSRYAAESALELAGPGAVLHLAHAISPLPIEGLEPVDPMWNEELRERMRQQLDELAASLELPANTQVETHILEGGIAEELDALAERVGADLLTAGSHGLGFFGRVLLGSVSSNLLRRTGHAVLVAPPREPVAVLGDTVEA